METKELKVAALRNGTVIDHIPADKAVQGGRPSWRWKNAPTR